ncbi:hypothetical protein MKW94_018391 [Papaver nudicaule]|uniref:Uncharacterized protein n=1 Tax=Papaver nudicaule TaxID=74823 RepID=A0AA41S1W1_PAPNU|nr:hypothetical protein [Papaver nudicaule]
MRICTLCYGALKAGSGCATRAIFSAECSHSFHFSCITSHVKLGNHICPICDVEWKDIPSDAPTSKPTSGPTRVVPILTWPSHIKSKPATLPCIPFRTNSNPNITSNSLSSEPFHFNDDDPLDFQFKFPSKDKSVVRSIHIKTFTELSTVRRSVAQKDFHVLVNLKAHVTDMNQVNSDIPSPTRRAPVDLVTILDVSGSMTGTKIQLLKRAMGFVIENLGPFDRLSVITISSNARRLFPLFLMTDSGKQHALQAVNSLFAGGETNILEGLKKGAQVIEDRKHKNPVCSIMLLSDGQDTVKNRIHLQEKLRLKIPVHTFGFGEDHDPVKLHSIAEGSKGTFSFIENEGLIQDAFAQCIGGLLGVVAQDLQVHIQSLEPNLCLSQLKAGSYYSDISGNDRIGFIDIGELYADEERDVLVLVNIPSVVDEDSSNRMKLVSVRCTYRDPFTKESMTTDTIEVKIQRPGNLIEDLVVSVEVDRQKNRFRAAEAMRFACAAADKGDLPNARAIIDRCRMWISESVSMRAGDKLSVALDAELQEVWSRMGSKKIYESTGRGYILSGMSSHSMQKATARGDSTETSSPVHAYQTPPIFEMLKLSRMSLPNFLRPKRIQPKFI